jgi:predicted hydrolase (HD superfamily)
MLSQQTQTKVDALIGALVDRIIQRVHGAGELPLNALDTLTGLIAAAARVTPDLPSPICGFIIPASPEKVDDE